MIENYAAARSAWPPKRKKAPAPKTAGAMSIFSPEKEGGFFTIAGLNPAKQTRRREPAGTRHMPATRRCYRCEWRSIIE
jgi:hypothetical protein